MLHLAPSAVNVAAVTWNLHHSSVSSHTPKMEIRKGSKLESVVVEHTGFKFSELSSSNSLKDIQQNCLVGGSISNMPSIVSGVSDLKHLLEIVLKCAPSTGELYIHFLALQQIRLEKYTHLYLFGISWLHAEKLP